MARSTRVSRTPQTSVLSGDTSSRACRTDSRWSDAGVLLTCSQQGETNADCISAHCTHTHTHTHTPAEIHNLHDTRDNGDDGRETE